MADVTPLLVMSIALALIHGGAPTPASPEDCGAGKTVVEEGQTRVVAEEQEENSYISLTRYVNPEPGFQGLSVSVDGNNDTRFSAWFNATADCFPADDKWLQLVAFASIWSDENIVAMGFKVGECWKKCEKNITVEKLLQLNVSAHGPSEWLTDEPPSYCDVTKVKQALPKPSSLPVCSDPPTPSPHTTEVSTTLWWPWLLVGLVALAIVAAVSYNIYKKEQQKLTTSCDAGSWSQPAEAADALHTVENDLYVPADTYADTTSGQEDPPTGNSTQPIEPTSDTVTIVNDMYEPCGNYEGPTFDTY